MRINKTLYLVNNGGCILQMLLRRSVSLLLRPGAQGREVIGARGYLTDGAPVIGSEPDRSYNLPD